MYSLSTMLTLITFLFHTVSINCCITKSMNQYHHGNLRESLLCEAIRQLEDIGSEKLSLRALARAVGVSQTAPYRHFKDKETLLNELAVEGFNSLKERMLQVTERCESLDEALIEAGVAYVDAARAYPAMYKLMFGSAMACRDSYPPLQQATTGCIRVLKDLIQKRMDIADPEDEMLWYLTINAAAHIKGHTSMVLEGNHSHPATGEPIDIRKALRFFLACLNKP